MEKFPNHVFTQTDFKNMFGTARRAAGLKNIMESGKCKEFERILNREAIPESHVYIRKRDGKISLAPYTISEGGEQGATSSLIISCAALQPHLEALDGILKPHKGSARMGIDDGVMHGPPEVLFLAMDKFLTKFIRKQGWK